MNEYTPLIVTANTATLLAGGALVTLAYRAYRRTRSPPLRALAVGVGCIVLGSILGGAAHLLGGDIAMGVALQSSFVALGFALLLYSLYARTTTATTVSGGWTG